jgi:hypothetical protein
MSAGGPLIMDALTKLFDKATLRITGRTADPCIMRPTMVDYFE